ncbi:DMT family transporter [Paraburkholderia sp. HD33-4]|uniref:DMT family transporter n=1 Tax=Paraburkholderia sp. HD33-4 TaxID=2883242 RepID=UPI001F2BBFAF|nr:DMT family transporter [Paraburkholderia sp. HD33-4]
MSVLFGIGAAMCWGLADFLAKSMAEKGGVAGTMFLSSAIGLTTVSVWLGIQPGAMRPLVDASGSLSIAAATAASVSASFCLTSGLAIGQSAVVAPIAMCYGAVTTVLSLCSGESLTVRATTGVLICLGGIPLAAGLKLRGSESRTGRRALMFACAAAILYGIAFWLQGHYAIPRLGTLTVLLANYGVTFCVSALGCIRKVSQTGGLARSPVFILQSSTNVCALCFLVLGMRHGGSAVVTVLSALSGGVTAMFGLVLRRERLSRTQWAGVFTTTLGAAMIAASSRAR